jgi:hypothetical protein
MNKNAIKKYAIWARRELLAKCSQKAMEFGVTEKGWEDENADAVNGHILSQEEKRERQELIRRVKEKGFQAVMDEAAYTWFNRFTALRFMEVNGYLPHLLRIFSDETGAFHPGILKSIVRLDLPGLDQAKVFALKEANKDEELYKYLLILLCNDLATELPGMFEKISDYTVLLLPDYLLREGSVLEHLVKDIPEEDWKDQVQIIGWLYQYYNTEPKQDVFDGLKKNRKITKDTIGPATQLFTPDWIVRYMVENSLGRLWLSGHPDEALQAKWKYYLPEAKQDADVEKKIEEIRKERKSLRPEDLTLMDPCMGSGHILAYAFDVLMDIYRSQGVPDRIAAKSIVEHNLFGLDIDTRAAQLAYFAVMMKGRQYDRRFLKYGIEPHVYAIRDSASLDKGLIAGFADTGTKLRDDLDTVVSLFKDAKEVGSLITLPAGIDFPALLKRAKEMASATSLFAPQVRSTLLPLLKEAELLSSQYLTCCTNPPYANMSHLDGIVSDFIKKNYADYKFDLFSVFMARCCKMTAPDGYLGFLSPYVWMFISSYEKLRYFFIEQKTIETLIQFEYSAFEEATVPICTFVLANRHWDKKGVYLRLTEYRGGMEVQREKMLEGKETHNPKIYFEANAENFGKIPGSPVAYWASLSIVTAFDKYEQLSEDCETKKGLATSNNNRFLRLWHEVGIDNVSFDCKSNKQSKEIGSKWFPDNKGGSFRRWYGNNEYLINWQNDGYEIRNYKDDSGKLLSRPQNLGYNFKQAITWSKITSGNYSARLCFGGSLFDDAAAICYNSDLAHLYYVIGFLNSNTCQQMLRILNPTLNVQIGDIGHLPIKMDVQKQIEIEAKTKRAVALSKTDWDAFETSWDFQRSPLLPTSPSEPGTLNHEPRTRTQETISSCYESWKSRANAAFRKLKENEEELNRIFIDIYGLQDELTPEESAKDVTIHFIVDKKEDAPDDMKGSAYLLTKEDCAKELISYAVGCMLGRYSLDVPGLAFAGGTWDDSKYSTYKPDRDGIIPISDDEYFGDDIVALFIDWLKAAYGEDTLEENLKWLAGALGGKGTARDVLRKYFLTGFYKDHCKTYQKRPIYWLFDSGKKNGFKCLIYMHRYQPDTIARIRTDYVHEQQARYRTALEELDKRLEEASGSQKVKLQKQRKVLADKEEEVHLYEEKIHHLADRMIAIDLDDGVKHNYEIFKDVLAKIQ